MSFLPACGVLRYTGNLLSFGYIRCHPNPEDYVFENWVTHEGDVATEQLEKMQELGQEVLQARRELAINLVQAREEAKAMCREYFEDIVTQTQPTPSSSSSSNKESTSASGSPSLSLYDKCRLAQSAMRESVLVHGARPRGCYDSSQPLSLKGTKLSDGKMPAGLERDLRSGASSRLSRTDTRRTSAEASSRVRNIPLVGSLLSDVGQFGMQTFRQLDRSLFSGYFSSYPCRRPNDELACTGRMRIARMNVDAHRARAEKMCFHKGSIQQSIEPGFYSKRQRDQRDTMIEETGSMF
ncbi:unnamed protein product [Amoebophrya sp. A25]|nr:unnamed protein product [Amoebophrya sp. A25]|eukprot:GSA25T00011134001.1